MDYIRMMCQCKAHCFNFGLGDGDEKDEDEFDDDGGANDPGNPIWDGSDVHSTWRGTDPTVPDANDVSDS